MKKARFAILFLLLALIAACLPAAAELPAEITLICLAKDRVHKLVEYVYFDDFCHFGRYQCTHCGLKVIPYSAQESHSGGTATCTELAVCTLCEHTYGDYAHDLVFHAGQAATCTQDGWKDYYTCTKCDYSTYETIPVTEHDLEHRGGRPASCMAEGWKEYDACRNCNYTTYEPIPKLGHLFERHPGQAATCTEDGWQAYDTCGRCSYTTYEPIPASGHDLIKHAAQRATCTEVGWEAYETCKNCDYTTYAEIPASGHSYSKQVVEPTCTKDGYTLYTCVDCNETYTTDVVKKLYHWFAEWSPNEDDTSSARCRRKGCKYVAKVDCQKFEFPLDGESLILCPVCGKVENGERLERIAKASAKIVTGRRPKGELIVRTDGTFLSVANEYAGKISEAAAQIKITLPGDLLNGRKPVLVSLDGAETALPFETAGDKITFTLDFAEAEVPVFLIRLTDEA